MIYVVQNISQYILLRKLKQEY